MCLSIVDVVTNKGNGKGYKVFALDDSSHLKSECFRIRYHYNRWYKANNTLITSGLGNSYESGFHIFTNLEDAIDWKFMSQVMSQVIRAVKYKNVVASGFQLSDDNLKVIVAKEMMILKPEQKRDSKGRFTNE
jgi:hypothetical protein